MSTWAEMELENKRRVLAEAWRFGWDAAINRWSEAQVAAAWVHEPATRAALAGFEVGQERMRQAEEHAEAYALEVFPPPRRVPR